MNRLKKLGVLSGVLIIACVAALVALHTNEKQEEIKTNGETVLSVEPDSVTALSWTYDETTLSFHRDDVWQYDDDAEFPVSDSSMDALLEEFRDFAATFTIENADDLSQYGLDEPVCTITLTADDQTYTVKLGDYSTMDSQRYVDIGDGNVYLAASDPLDTYDVELSDLIANDSVPDFDGISQIAFAGDSDVVAVYDEDAKSLCADDAYFTSDGQPLDTSLLSSYISKLSNLNLTNYVTYKATDADLSAYGLDNPELTISIDYTDDETSGTFVLYISRDPEELKTIAEEGTDTDDEDTADITAYARVGDSKIIYKIAGSSYKSLMAAGYDDLRHQEIFSGDFEDVTAIDVTLDGNTCTLTMQEDGSEQKWLYQEQEIDIDDLQDALQNLTAGEFTDEEASGQQEISLTLHLDNEAYPELTITLYRYDGTTCLAVVDGASVAYIPRSEAVDLMEAVRAIIL
jgi:hypothetical protein